MAQSLSLEQLQQCHGILIDTRDSAFYNGWPYPLTGTSGHEPAARHLAAGWLKKMDDPALHNWTHAQAISANTPIGLYGDALAVANVSMRLQRLGLGEVACLSDALKIPSRLVSLAAYWHRVYPLWLHDLLQGKAVSHPPAGEWQVIEVGCDELAAYRQGHIPGARYLDTREVESLPLWNVLPDAGLAAMLARHRIRHDTTLLLYSRNPVTAARVAWVMLYAGVADVRLLEGDWGAQDLPLHIGDEGLNPRPETDFGLSIPVRPHLKCDKLQARRLLQRQDASLVSVRSWQEHTGKTSGYTYIQAAGDIPGARWGHAGEGKDGMEDYLNPDGTVRSAELIGAMWQAGGITPDQQIAFYCGTGWRAALAFMSARAMGWPQIAVYDGGWFEWSQETGNDAK
ncbi:sulfurtransferase [Phytobacter sp. V91]|uniref:sulfurtransferase n=1 Tax=Phytobacter sp. V91 TaxID=3369425 RepID=UPI003F6045FE